MSVILKTSDSFKWGHKNVIPFIGETQISAEGTIEVDSQETADKIVALEIGFNHVIGANPSSDNNEKLEDKSLSGSQAATAPTTVESKSEKLQQTQSEPAAVKESISETTSEQQLESTDEKVQKEDPTKEDQVNEDTSASLSEEEKGELIKSIDTLTVPELQVLAAPFPKEEWKHLLKEPLQDYLKSKLL